MNNREIKLISPSNVVDMGGFPVRQPLPAQGLEMVDPFLLLHHAEISYKNARGAEHSGVGPHPHRGFSPVSFVFNGGVHHRDSLGNDSIIYSGGVQWINAGSGITHSERPPAELVGSDDQQEFVQLWVNTPAAHKMDEPSYQGYSRDEIPNWESEDGLFTFGVVSGTFHGAKGPVISNTEVVSAMGYLKASGVSKVVTNPKHHVMLYLLDGLVKINGKEVTGKNLVVFDDSGDGFELEVIEDTKCLYLSGAPIKETVSSYGPFVMNTQREIIEALNDAHEGKMGTLVENF